MELIDLHAHTTASDGTLSPAELVDLAEQAGLKALAVTDHDTLDGLPEALARGKEISIEVIPGVEISAEFKPGTMHILGYLIDYQSGPLADKLERLQQARRDRNPQIVAKLNGLGMEISMDEIVARAGGGQIGRPHFAKVLMDKGYVGSVQEAFDRYLAKGGAAYVDKFRFTPQEAIELIHRAGGVAVLAHPFTLRLSDEDLDSTLADFKDAGLDGLEVYYSEHTPDMSRAYVALAEKYSLAPSGGSDFHGNNKDKIKLGTGLGDLRVPYSFLTGLKKRRKEIQ
jgi:predicted metal-dependent phosphoesterase TrpH